MRMGRLLIGAAVVVSCIALAGCSVAPTFESQLTASVGEFGEGPLVLSSLDGVSGDVFLVVCPYESKSSIEERLGFDWAGAPDYSQQDAKQTIVFIDDGKVTSHAEMARDSIDFCGDAQWPALPSDTPLEVARTDQRVLIDLPS